MKKQHIRPMKDGWFVSTEMMDTLRVILGCSDEAFKVTILAVMGIREHLNNPTEVSTAKIPKLLDALESTSMTQEKAIRGLKEVFEW